MDLGVFFFANVMEKRNGGAWEEKRRDDGDQRYVLEALSLEVVVES